MRFQVISHAGLLIENQSTSLMCDPWILGSCYWRSWWNYPPVSEALVDALNPEFIYLTHMHWDHFHGDSLRKLGKDKKIIIPKGNNNRIKRDLNKIGFKNVVELKHGESLELGENFKITSYQYSVLLDSALIIEVDGKVLLNLNDSKHMGPTLKQITSCHPSIDFVFRSHSSANGRLCFEIIDDPDVELDDINQYIASFAGTVCATGAKYAIPFASNNCFLHSEVMRFNKLVQTPKLVEQFFESHHIDTPEVKVMVSGDSYDSQKGFQLSNYDWFANREIEIEKYRERVFPSLQNQAEKEAKVGVSREQLENYFKKFTKTIPFFIRYKFKRHPITYILKKGDEELLFEVDIFHGTVKTLKDYDDERNPLQVHTSAFMIKQCIALDLFSHLSISKRVCYRAYKKNVKYIRILDALFNFYEYDMLPLHRLFSWRSLETWSLRWRELWLFMCLLRNKGFEGSFGIDKYMKLPPSEQK